MSFTVWLRCDARRVSECHNLRGVEGSCVIEMSTPGPLDVQYKKSGWSKVSKGWVCPACHTGVKGKDYK